MTLDGKANAANPISEKEAEVRDRIHNRQCSICGRPYLYALKVTNGPEGSACQHDDEVKPTTLRNADRNVFDHISQTMRREEQKIRAGQI